MFGVSIGFLCLLLVPLSLASNELKVFFSLKFFMLNFFQKVLASQENLYPEWWLEWLTAELLLGFWNRVSIVCR